jgi:hypothetical protein
VQQWLATRPATDRQIQGAIRAAEQVLSRRERRGPGPPRLAPVRRLWAMGLFQIVLGYLAVMGALAGATALWPALARWVE